MPEDRVIRCLWLHSARLASRAVNDVVNFPSDYTEVRFRRLQAHVYRLLEPVGIEPQFFLAGPICDHLNAAHVLQSRLVLRYYHDVLRSKWFPDVPTGDGS